MNSRTRKQLLAFAASTGILFQLGGTAHAVQVFDLGEFVVRTPVQETIAEEIPVVTGDSYVGGQVSTSNLMGVLGNQSFLESPVNVTGYTNELMENKQAATISEVVANDPSVKEHSLSGASSAWKIRGFRTTQQDMQFNGLFGIAPRFYTGTEGYDRVEVAKGPTALLSGVAPNGGNIGGSINFVPKRAKDTPINRIKLSYGNGNQFTQHVDVGQRFGENNKYGIRLNVMNRNGETSVEDEKVHTNSIVLGADVRGNRHRVALDLGYVYNEIENPQYRVSLGGTNEQNGATLLGTAGYSKNNPFELPVVSNDMKFGALGTHRRVTEKYGVLSGEYDINKDWTAYAGFGMRYTSMDYLYNEYVIRDINRFNSRVTYRYNNQLNKGISAEAGVRGKIKTSGATHHVGLAFSRISYEVYMANRTFLGNNNQFNGNFFNQFVGNAWGTPTGDRTWYSPLDSKTTNFGVSISDRIVTNDEKWQLILGGRFQKIKETSFANNLPARTATTNFNNRRTTTTSYSETAFSPSVGLIHKFNDKASFYANYMEGLQAGAVAPSGAANEGEIFAPTKSKQIEFGTKFDLGNWASTLSIFQIKNPALSAGANNYYGLNTEVRNRGIEWNVFGEPVKGTRVLGGIMYLDAKYTKDNTSANITGNRYVGTPKWNAVLGLEQDVKSVEGLTFTTRLNYVGSSYANEANSLRVPGHFTWDLGARYNFKVDGTPLTVRADVFNVLNKDYWNALDRNSVFLGNGRTYMVSLTADL